VRYADDIVVGFQHESEAGRFRIEQRQRLAKFGLELNTDKTRLVRFGRFAVRDRAERGQRRPETFDFLGFTHICAISYKGQFVVKRLTMKKRMRAKLREVRTELMRRRHLPLPEQGVWLSSVVNGYFAYHAVPTNSRRMAAFRTQVSQSWLHALRRRSQRSRMTWERMQTLVERWLPPSRLRHPWPVERFHAKTRGRSPVR
jgi:hypothetical protein